MGEMGNPWIAAAAAASGTDQTAAPEPAEVHETGPVIQPPSGVAAPLANLIPPEAADRFGRHVAAQPGQLWLVSTHGGAGSSALGAALGLPAVTRAWPYAAGRPVHVLLVCRSNLHGLETARLAAREWASQQWAASNLPGVQVHALVVVADAPGRTPKPLKQLEEHVSGAVPRLWRVAWEERLRTNPSTPGLVLGAWKSLAQQVQLLRKQVTDE